jgi:hypothetical protein
MKLASLSSWAYSCELYNETLNPLNAELNPICHFLALLGAHPIFHISGVRINDLYCSPNIIRVIQSKKKMRWDGHVARMGERRDAYRVLVERPVRKKLLGRLKLRWEDDIKMDVQKVAWECIEWINLAQGRDRCRAFVNTVMKLRVP